MALYPRTRRRKASSRSVIKLPRRTEVFILDATGDTGDSKSALVNFFNTFTALVTTPAWKVKRDEYRNDPLQQNVNVQGDMRRAVLSVLEQTNFFRSSLRREFKAEGVRRLLRKNRNQNRNLITQTDRYVIGGKSFACYVSRSVEELIGARRALHVSGQLIAEALTFTYFVMIATGNPEYPILMLCIGDKSVKYAPVSHQTSSLPPKLQPVV